MRASGSCRVEDRAMEGGTCCHQLMSLWNGLLAWLWGQEKDGMAENGERGNRGRRGSWQGSGATPKEGKAGWIDGEEKIHFLLQSQTIGPLPITNLVWPFPSIQCITPTFTSLLPRAGL